MNPREILIKLMRDEIGVVETFVKEMSDIEMIAKILEHIVPKIEEIENHSHTIS